MIELKSVVGDSAQTGLTLLLPFPRSNNFQPTVADCVLLMSLLSDY